MDLSPLEVVTMEWQIAGALDNTTRNIWGYPWTAPRWR